MATPELEIDCAKVELQRFAYERSSAEGATLELVLLDRATGATESIRFTGVSLRALPEFWHEDCYELIDNWKANRTSGLQFSLFAIEPDGYRFPLFEAATADYV